MLEEAKRKDPDAFNPTFKPKIDKKSRKTAEEMNLG